MPHRLTCCRSRSLFDADIIRPSRQSQEDVITMAQSQRLTEDLVIDVPTDSMPAPTASSHSVVCVPNQHFILTPGAGPGPDLHRPLTQSLDLQPRKSSQSFKASQSPLSESQAGGKDAQTDLLLSASAPTTQNLAQFQQHQSAAEEAEAEDLIRAHPVDSPQKSTFWMDDSR